MITKHFFKTLFIFTLMITLGLVGVFLVEHFDQEKNNSTNASPVAK